MISLKHWLRPLIVALIVGASTMSCQVIFGDFKVGQGARGGESGTAEGNTSGGENAHGGAAGNAQSSGPILVVPTSDLYTSESGAQAKFYVSLARQPVAPVYLPIVSTNLAEGRVYPAGLAFSVDDWNAPQQVIVTGVEDKLPGNQPYTVEVGPATSEDKFFQGAKAVVPVTNIDNDSAGFFVSPTTGLVTTEAGGQAVFTVVLNKAPMEPVVVMLTSSDASIGVVAPSSLMFTAENWSAPQTVTLTGMNDNVAGTDRTYQITVGPLMSADQTFATLPSQSVNVTNRDNDTAGVTVTLAAGIDPLDTTRLRTSENGESARFAVVLNNAPEKNVIIAVASSSGEGTVSPPVLTFTPLNWSAEQQVTVVGVDNDSAADGNQPYQITLDPSASSDDAYRTLTSADLPHVNVVNVDNDAAGIAVTLLTGVDPSDASELLTSEKKTSATFSVALTSKPKAPIHFGLTSTNSAEGDVSTAALDFTGDNWNLAQTVTVTGVDDSAKDGNVVYVVRISAPMTEDPAYQKLPATDVKVVNQDDDVAGITMPKLLSGVDTGGAKLFTTEANKGSATFSVSLTSKPAGDVKLPVSSSDMGEGTATPASLTFTPANYATPQVVTVTGVDDPGVDGDQAYTVSVGPSTSSGDPNYVGLSQSVKVTNRDDDSAYIVPTPGFTGTTTEKGGTAVFGISLHSQPTAPVTLTFKSLKESEGKVMPLTLSFSTSNWATAQNITVTGVDDAIDDGDQTYTVSVTGASAGDQNYKYAATSLSLVNVDDDTANMKITAAANLQTTEAGGKATFTVVLTSQPTANVTIAVSSGTPKEGTVSPASLVFTASNWNTPQTVTVTGVDDSVADTNQMYTVTLKCSSADSKYAQLAAGTVSLVNVNDDVVGITVAPTSCATTPGTTATFSVVLKSQPLGLVTIGLSSDKPAEGTVAPVTLSFTATNWNTAQTVTVTGVDDATMGVMTAYKIVTAAAVSASDSSYNGFNAADVACINTTPEPPPDP